MAAAPSPSCPAEEINRAIRAFLADRERPLTPAERRVYEELRARWVDAIRRRGGVADCSSRAT
ncbi:MULTISPECIES: hypothetical protein [Streptomyces]|uniref:hypothetical protein n=1 Tax=Streptomyces TaxID=1883 RepID=UPI00163D2196|nr:MULTISPECIES: hypothetical protein [Streptomyces]MBC2874040.1 hypothetical protein [Streptomyces sp. TYQ1024]UBI39025.1 hypothetical protein K7I03_22920 [Streptomyces mobaraensis]UKW31603.1 hypothetical protein MCU78_22865 [Streptomyces sp. TYQ1024]